MSKHQVVKFLLLLGTCTSAFAQTVPGAPSGVAGTPGNTSVTLTWTAPALNGGDTITSYTAAASPGGATCIANKGVPVFSGCRITGLTNGTSYVFTVTATNAAGTGPVSSSSPAVVPATIPAAPTSVIGTSSNNSVAVSWAAPTSNGGSAVTSYTATAFANGAATNFTCTSNSGSPVTPSCSVTGLTNGTSYTFTVTATNGVGASAPSANSSAVTAGVPGPPTSVIGTSGNDSVALIWTPPQANGTPAITSYTAFSSPGNFTCVSNSGSPVTPGCTITGLSNGTPYTFTVVAVNSVGTGVVSAASAAVIPATVPGAPTAVMGTPGNASVALSWIAPSTGGAAITSYTATSNPGSFTCTSTSGSPVTPGCTVMGLTNGTPYTFVVTATNSVSKGIASAVSAAVIPVTVPSAPTAIAGTWDGNTSVILSWTAPASNGGSPITSYTATSNPGNLSCTSSTGSPITPGCTMTGVFSGTSFTFTVTATNSSGTSTASIPSAVVTTGPLGPPPAHIRVAFLEVIDPGGYLHSAIHIGTPFLIDLLNNPTGQTTGANITNSVLGTGAPPQVPVNGFQVDTIGNGGTGTTGGGATAGNIAKLMSLLDSIDVLVLNNSLGFGGIIPASDAADRAKFLHFADTKGIISLHSSIDNHSSSSTAPTWPSYDSLTAVQTLNHVTTTASELKDTIPLDTTDASFNSLQVGLLPKYTYYEEMYSFTANPRPIAGIRVLHTLDEKSFATPPTTAMGDHPFVWYRLAQSGNGGRYWYTGEGHVDSLFQNNYSFRREFYNAVVWAAGTESTTSLKNQTAGELNPSVFKVWTSGSSLMVNVSQQGLHTIDIRTLDGKRLFTEKGNGPQIYSFNLRPNSVYTITITSSAGPHSKLIALP